MGQEFVLGIDFGTSVVKATAMELTTANCIQHTRQYNSSFEQRSCEGWTQVFKDTVRSITERLPADSRYSSLAVTGMVPNVCLVDNDNAEIGTLLFCDNEAYDLEDRLDHELSSPKWANEVLSKILFLSKRNNGFFKRWYTTHNWINYLLTGRYAIDSITASETGNLIVPGSGWSNETLSAFHLQSETFPEIVAPIAIIGNVKNDLGIPQLNGIPIVAGSSDTLATALGAGLSSNPLELLIYYGTFNCAALIHGGRDTILESALPRNPFEWVLSIPRAGDQLRHIAELFGIGDSLGEKLKSLDIQAQLAPAGSNGLIFLHSEDIRKTTVSSKPIAQFRNISPSHTRADFCRAVLEGFSYLLRWSFQELSDRKISQAICAGGGARSKVWRQIVTDVTGVAQNYRPKADRGLGSALLALAALDKNAYGNLDSILGSEAIKLHPLPNTAYNDQYRKYLSSWSQ